MPRESGLGPCGWNDAPLPYQSLDEQGRILEVNTAWEQYTGYSAEDVVGTELRDLVPAECREEYDRACEMLTRTERLTGCDIHLQHRSGSQLACRVFGRLADAVGGRASHCMLVDVAAQHGAERALLETEQRYEALFNLAPTPIVVHNGREVLLANEASARFMGYDSAADLIGHPMIDFVHPDDRLQVADRVRRMFREGGSVPLREERFIRADGGVATGDTVAAPVIFSGQPAVHVVLLETTERKAAEQAARESEIRFRQLFDNNRDPIVVHDGSAVILVNAAAKSKFGFGEETDVAGMGIEQFVHPEAEELVRTAIAELLSTGVSRGPMELRLLSLEGTEWVAEVSTSQLDLDGRTLLQSVFRDLTERKRQEAELADYRDQLERIVQERTETLYEVKANLQAVTAVISQSVEIRDPYTAGHQRRVAALAVAIARRMGMSDEVIDEISVAALLHDIGKLGVPAEILSKPTLLSPLEYELVKKHAEAGYQIIASAHLGGPVAEIVHQHHERLDGSGYPRGLDGSELLMSARILGVADVVEAMMSHRPYRPALGFHAAMEEISANSGRLYDEEVVAVCTEIMESGFEFEPAKR